MIHPIGDSESETESSFETSPEAAPDVGCESSENEDEVSSLRRQVHELTAALKNMMSHYARLAALLGITCMLPTPSRIRSEKNDPGRSYKQPSPESIKPDEVQHQLRTQPEFQLLRQ